MVAFSRRRAPLTMGRRLIPLHLALAAGLWGAPARATPICVDVGDQANVIVVPDGSGGAVLVWEDGRHGYDPGLRAQHLLSTGDVDPAWPLGGRALTTAHAVQSGEWAIPDGAGGMIVTWSDGVGVYAQHMRASGTVDPAWPANGVQLPNAETPRDIVSDGSGGGIVVWDGVYAQHVRAVGSLDPAWPVNGRAVAPGTIPRAVSDGAHGVLVAFAAGSEMRAQHVLATGAIAPGWPANGVVLSSGLQPIWPSVVSDGAGGAIVTWEDDPASTNWDIHAQRIRSDGTLAPGWPAAGLAVCTADNAQELPVAVADGTGGAFIAWQDHRPGSTTDIYAQHLLANGSLAAGWPVNGRAVCDSPNDQLYPQIASDNSGGAIVTWQDACNAWNGTNGYDIYAQRIKGDGSTAAGWPEGGREVQVAYGPQRLCADGSGGAVIAWQDLANGNDWNVYAQKVRGDGATPGTLDVPPADRLLLAVGPANGNPGSADRIRVRYSASDASVAQIDLIDLRGQVLGSREVASAGTHEIELAPASRIAPGVYLLRIRQGGRQRVARVSLLR